MEEKNSISNLMLPDEVITSKIYLIRGEKVMVDRDLAILFNVKAIRLREQVRRNLEKFPEHFMFQLTSSEADLLVSQNAIPSLQYPGGSLPLVLVFNIHCNQEMPWEYSYSLVLQVRHTRFTYYSS